ncbi:putative transmembrane protein [Heterostelium album PN500]|uniref:Mannosyltransferase n=1 Tax=Heterostelium pallidum (strain ATCC 26659 / Pp 5 / PN500) TaxID=670386 RepID=D3BM61_HETP5|nr:putative transmembrane protein [Heterostelium album PN500]EFA77662.1 putative transmembrane protein [Heterostelium album PN500]|eukprot:XP_020429790.1 putative transmembrane protein [Heterostelium album PN500]
MTKKQQTHHHQQQQQQQSNGIFDIIDRNIWVFVFLMIIFRCINSLLINTFFDPDEYWQSLEVAHQTVFGYGYLTWEWSAKIRSFLHPMLFAIVYKLLLLFKLDTPYAVIIVPKLLQGIVAAVGDIYLYKLSKAIFGKECAKWTLIINLINWYTFVCIVRTYSNSIETVLFVISLYYWPLPGKTQPSEANYKIFNNVQISVILTSFAFIIRPTTAIMWLYLVPLYLYSNIRSLKQLLLFVFRDVLLVAVCVLTISIYVDYLFYHEITLVPFNFLYFNVIKNISALYGTHPIWWYFVAGFPTIASAVLPLFAYGVYRLWSLQQKDVPNRLHLAYCAMSTIALYSLLAHKEFRFIFPILPLAVMYAGLAVASLKVKYPQSNLYKIVIGSFIVINIPLIVFFSNIHQKSPIDVIHYINSEVSPLHQSPNANASIHFLTSCHATPYQSYIHNPYLELKILECPPPVFTEKDLFFYNPQMYLLKTYAVDGDLTLEQYQSQNSFIIEPHKLKLPNYFVVRDDVLNDFTQSWLGHHYQQMQTFGSALDVTSYLVLTAVIIVNIPNNPFQQQAQQQYQLQQQQQQLQQAQQQAQQQYQQQQAQQQQQQQIQQHQLDTAPLKRSRLNNAQVNVTRSSDYSYFNNIQSPISNIVSNLDKYKPTIKKQPAQPIVFNSDAKSHINNINNNNKNILNSNNNNNENSNNNNNNDKKLFSLEEVREILKKALEEHEAKLRREYEDIVQQKLLEQFHSFSQYNESYISRQIRESEFSYMS